MSDSITEATCFKDPTTSKAQYYKFCFKVDNGFGNTTTLDVVISASDMQDPSDQNEALASAKTKALAMKNSWSSGLAASPHKTDINNLTGPVTL